MVARRWSAVLVLLAGCTLDRSGIGDDSGPSPQADAGPGRRDGGGFDAGPVGRDGGGRDGGERDGGGRDGGVDAGAPDAGCPRYVPAADEVLAAPRAVAVDGELSEWRGAPWVAIAPPADFRLTPTPGGPADLSARLAAAWSADRLYFAVEVTDDRQRGERTEGELWNNDSVQVAFDVSRNGGSDYDGVDDYEYGLTLVDGATAQWRWHVPGGDPGSIGVVARDGGANRTRYEIELTAAQLGVAGFSAGDVLGFAWIVNEADSRSGMRQGFLEWRSGIGIDKDPSLFGRLTLRASACE